MVKRPPKPTFDHVWRESIKPALDELKIELSERELSICNSFMRWLWDVKARFDGKVVPELVQMVENEVRRLLSDYSDVADRLKIALETVARQFGIVIKV